MRIDRMIKLVVDAMEDIKARDIVVFDVRKITPMFDRVIIASGDSTRQNKAIAANVREKAKAAGITVVSSEGEENGEWVLVDLGDIVVHVMQPAVRTYYNLEEIWGTVPAPAPRKRAARKSAGPAAG